MMKKEKENRDLSKAVHNNVVGTGSVSSGIKTKQLIDATIILFSWVLQPFKIIPLI